MPKLEGVTDPEEDVTVTGGTFTQDQVSSIVQDRLARQKAKLLSQYQKDLEEGTKAKQDLEIAQAKAKKYDTLITESLKDRKAKLPPGVLSLLNKLSPEDQVAWLDDPANKIETPASELGTGPKTPPIKEQTPDVKKAVALKAQDPRYRGL